MVDISDMNKSNINNLAVAIWYSLYSYSCKALKRLVNSTMAHGMQ